MKKTTCWWIVAIILTYPALALTAPEFVRESKSIFAHPHDIEIDPTGRWLFVADTNNHNIKVLDATTLEQHAVIGEGELNAPHDVHFDDVGRLLVADSGNDRVVIYQLKGLKASLDFTISEHMESPEGVTSSPDGHIFVASTGSHKILKFFQNRLVKETGRRGDDQLEFVRPHDIERGPDGLLYIGDPGNRRIQILTEDLMYHSQMSDRNKPYNEPKYLALDKENLLYLADQQNNLLRIYDEGRKQLHAIAVAGTKPLNYPEGVEVDGARLWISDTYNNRIVLFNRVRR